MMNPGPVEEVSKQVGNFFHVLKEQPLSLALVIMNFLLVAYLFYSGSQMLKQRAETTKMIVSWQEKTDMLMASCVSKEIMQLVLDALHKTNPLPIPPIQIPTTPQPLVPP
jgi:hypothetical protein